MKSEVTTDDSHQDQPGQSPVLALLTDSTSADAEQATEASEDVQSYVCEYLDRHQIEVQYDGSLSVAGALLRADAPHMAIKYLQTEILTSSHVLDDMALDRDRRGVKTKKGLVKAALQKELRRRRKERRNSILLPLVEPAPEENALAAKAEWARLGQLFDMPVQLSCDCIRHFIWQVKSKSLGRRVVHHLMPVIFSPQQGSGKTTFVRALISPLKDLASADALISDFADHRSGDIYGFPVVVVDDMEQLPKETVPIVKSLITSESIVRRRLHTSQATSTRQKATLIGTANRPIHELVEDETGHRRFAMMPFRNGNVAKGGEKEIWEIVSTLNYHLLWQSVDVYAASPILRSLEELHLHQTRDRPLPKLLDWLFSLDIDSEKIKRISVSGGVRADKLRDLYVMETGDVLSKQKFSDAMLLHMKDGRTPFSEKHKKEIGALYRVRQQRPMLTPVESQTLEETNLRPASARPLSEIFNSSVASASSASSGSSASPARAEVICASEVSLSPADGEAR
jgi:hypothetical protein